MFKGNLGELLRTAQEMGASLKAKQEELAAVRVPVSVGGGMVKMEFNGKGEALSLTIERTLVNPDEIPMLQDLVLSAVNEGLRQTQKAQQEALSKLAGGLKIPGITA
ncbi:MAG TPA: YbaB/EbfC family nucleoid-associated protein [bacterium]|nr:YbaB/EbfC family nucleoid-associated protein [bacterium]